MNRVLNFTSDTVTSMSNSMKEALVRATVGDAVHNTDPTVKQLERQCAELFGMESGLFVPTGTMGNLVSVLSHCQRGDSILLGDKSHLNLYEQGAISSLGGVFPQVLQNLPDGTFSLSSALSQVLPDAATFPRTTAISIENTHNYTGGRILPFSYICAVSKFSKSNNLELHIDGARIWHTLYHYRESCPQVTFAEITQGAASITMCFSKALRAPLGSVVCGSGRFVHRAARWRSALGGSMRQPGYIAAAALEALSQRDESIPADHCKAALLARGLQELGCSVELPMSNIVCLVPPPRFTVQEFYLELRARQVLVSARPFGEFLRLVTHPEVSLEDIEAALGRIQDVLKC